jgi:malate dehydrogenase (oxaloacetate-decarboxylating)
LAQLKVVINGAGAAGVAVVKLLISMGLKNVILCDREGAIFAGRPGLNQNLYKSELAKITNITGVKGSLKEALIGADVFIGVSAPGMVTEDMIKTMNPKPIIFPLANPVPEILPELAIQAGALVVGTGRSDFPNQINNVLAFPGIFRGALDVRASDINDPMKIAAAMAISNLIEPKDLTASNIIPKPFDPRVTQTVAQAVAQAARDTKVARI